MSVRIEQHGAVATVIIDRESLEGAARFAGGAGRHGAPAS
jgi:hypothetical protein